MLHPISPPNEPDLHRSLWWCAYSKTQHKKNTQLHSTGASARSKKSLLVQNTLPFPTMHGTGLSTDNTQIVFTRNTFSKISNPGGSDIHSLRHTVSPDKLKLDWWRFLIGGGWFLAGDDLVEGAGVAYFGVAGTS